MFNPAMISLVLQSKLDEIIQGIYPEGTELIERNDKTIVLGITVLNSFDNITFEVVNVSVVYKEIDIVLKYESKN